MEQNLKTVHIIIKGMVQGVGFRYYIRSLAHSLGVPGFVKNLSDGTVEIEMEGEQKKLKEILERIHTGEMSGYVSDMDIVWLPFKNKYDDFSIEF